MSTRNLDAVFAPRSVAIAGATDRVGSIGAQVVANISSSFKGPIYGVNPRRPEIAGIAMHSAVADLPEAPDLAIIVTPPETILPMAEAFAAKGARAAVIITDPKRGTMRAADVRDALRALADRTGMRIVGPNALGVWSPTLRATMSALSAPAGNIAFVGQATMAAGVLAEWATHQHLGFSHVAAAGDMTDVDYADVIDWCAVDARTRVIVVLMEHVGDARKLLSATRLAARVKPVIVLSVSNVLIDERREAVFDAALKRAGALRARDLEDLYAALEAVAVRLPSDAPPTLGRRIAIVANGESLGALARLALGKDDAELAVLDAATLDRLTALMPPGRRRSNPVDLLPDATPARYTAALEALFNDKGVDAVLAVFGPSGTAAAGDVAEAIAAVVDAARLKPGRRRPFVMTAFAGGASEAAAREALSRLHIPAFGTPSEAIGAFRALVALRRAAERVTATPEFSAGLEAPLAAELSHKLRAALDRGEAGIPGPVANAIRRALWLGRADSAPTLPWRIAIADDPDFGPAIFFGPGGAFGRIAGDLAAALPPLNAATAQELIASSRHARAAIAEGLIDDSSCYALAALLVRVSDLIAAAPDIRTLTIDGIMATDGRPVAPAEALFGTLERRGNDPDARFAIRPYPAHLITEVTDTKGTKYRLRPLRAEDEPAIGRLGARMSPEDLRLRFFQPLRTLSHEMAARLTQLDYDREMAFALTPLDHDAIVSVVRLHREARGDRAEFAVLVRSDLQGRGIGRLMMERIISYARSQGLRTLFGIVLAENQGMLKLSRALGFKPHTDPQDATVVRVEMDLKETP